MSATEGHDVFGQDAAAHVLGALSEAEETRFVRHLRTCMLCQEEVENLSIARDALARSVPQFEAPARIKAAVMGDVRGDLPQEAAPAPPARVREKGARLLGGMRLRAASLSASAVLAAGLAIGFGVAHFTDGGDPAMQTRTVAASFDRAKVGKASGSLTVTSAAGDDSGTLRVHGMPSLPPSETYQVWVQRKGEVIPKALFNVGDNGEGVSAVDSQLEGADGVLVTTESAGGARSPTSKPVLRVKL